MNHSLQQRREQIIKLRNSTEFKELDNYYRKKSFFNILNIARKENVHSDFLAWLFDPNEHHGLGNFALSKLLEVAVIVLNRFQKKDGIAKFPEHLEDIIISGSYSLSHVIIEREKSVGVGSIDLFVSFKINYEDEKENIAESLNIILENKVKSKEADNQTIRYSDWGERNLEGHRIYLYLTPLSNSRFEKLEQPECKCDRYIQLNYQYIVDFIIEPCRQRNITDGANLFIEEYLRTLSFPVLYDQEKSEIIMAICDKERELLRSFWNTNQELLIAVLSALSDDPEVPDEEREELSKGLNLIINASKNDFTKYNFMGKEYAKNRLVLAVVQKFVDNNAEVTYEELEKVFPANIQGNDRLKVFVDRAAAQSILDNSGHRRHFLKEDEMINLRDKQIAVCSQWGRGNIERFVKKARDLGFTIGEKNN